LDKKSKEVREGRRERARGARQCADGETGIGKRLGGEGKSRTVSPLRRKRIIRGPTCGGEAPSESQIGSFLTPRLHTGNEKDGKPTGGGCHALKHVPRGQGRERRAGGEGRRRELPLYKWGKDQLSRSTSKMVVF